MHGPINIKFNEKSPNSVSAELFYVSDICYQLKSTFVLFTTPVGDYYTFSTQNFVSINHIKS
jgi:hypothetical protein